MTAAVVLPAAKDVRDMLSGLLGKPVAVNPGADGILNALENLGTEGAS